MINLNPNIFKNNALKYKYRDYDYVDIGDFTYGSPTFFVWSEKNICKLKIGKFCSIADGVEIYFGGEHNSDWITTYPFSTMFDSNLNINSNAQKSKGDIIIGNDVWIGRGATILSGVTIGDGAVIGARSVVTKNVLPYAVVAGNPARFIRFRFTGEQIYELTLIKWWDWDYEKIAEYVPILESGEIDKFIEGAKND